MEIQQARQCGPQTNRNFQIGRTIVGRYHTLRVENLKRRLNIGIIRTDKWLEKNFDSPMKICEMLSVYFDGADPHTIYDYLKKFGMYKPGKTSKKTFESLKSEKIWGETEKIFEKYRKKWAGPDIPIFIFPLDKSNFQLVREGKGKSGVSFKDKIFLFLTPLEDAKELEALFVHEYHHACRMKGQKKDPGEYTLLDSMILEGLAEHAVAVNCGREYTGEWSRRYSKEDLSAYWNEDLKEQLTIKRNHRLHDEILFGIGRWPKLLGYAIGYEIVKQYKQRENFSEKASFTLSSANFTKLLNF